MATAEQPVEPCVLTVPPERHIPVELTDIHYAIRAKVETSERERFDQVVQYIQSVCHQRFGVFRRTMKHNLLGFSAGAKGQPMPSRVGRELPRSDELDAREDKVLEDFLQLMAAARFRVLTDQEWQTAMLEDFMFSLPVEVNFSVFDTRLLKRFWETTDDRSRLRQVLPDMADRILVLHRGVAVAEASGMYLNEKVDMLVDRLIVQPAIKAYHFVRPPPPPEHATHALQMANPVAAISAAGVPRLGSMPKVCHAPHRNQKTVERITLARLLPTSWDVLSCLFSTMHLKEPTFKEMVILYRTAEPTGAIPVGGALPVKPHEERLRDILARRNIHIRSFHDVPMADAEIIFPDKRVYIKPLSFISLAFTIITALVTAWLTIWKARDSMDLRLVWGVLSVVLARCMQVNTSMQGERSAIQQRMIQTQYSAALDSQEGVIDMLLDDMADQQTKEMIIAYALLLQKATEAHRILAMKADGVVLPNESGPIPIGLTEPELDRQAEDWLEATYALRSDFAVEDALARLVEWGLASVEESAGDAYAVGSDARYVPASLDKAQQLLSAYWAAAPLQQDALNEQIKALPLGNLLGDGVELPPPGSFNRNLHILARRPSKAKQYRLSAANIEAISAVVNTARIDPGRPPPGFGHRTKGLRGELHPADSPTVVHSRSDRFVSKLGGLFGKKSQ